MPIYFLWRQDMPILLAAAMLLWAFSLSTATDAAKSRPPALVWPPRFGMVLLLALLLVVGCWLGRTVIMHGYDFSRDEQMVTFDAAVFAQGHLALKLPADWAPLDGALNNLFHLNGGGALISNYRPVNAMLHAMFSIAGMAMLVSPIMTAIGAAGTWVVARRLWPDQGGLAGLALLLYVSSAQVWAMGMTTYAMAGHLGLNMVWLALYLRDDRVGHAGAMGIAFLATGLHQVAFHPMFAAPFLFWLVIDRRLLLAAFYAAGYAAIILFWSTYERFPLLEVGLLGQASAASAYLSDAVVKRAELSSLDNLWLTAANLARFFAWQHLLLLPLMIAGGLRAWRLRDRFFLSVIAALLFTPCVKLFLMPLQGHGWGYRYEHGLIGIACLLAAYGWKAFDQKGWAPTRHLAIATALTWMVALPWLLWQAHALSGVYARTSAAIGGKAADMVVVDGDAVPYARDLVINRADLGNRPLRLLAGAIGPVEAAALCQHGTIAFYPGSAMREISAQFALPATESKGFARAQALIKARCPRNIR